MHLQVKVYKCIKYHKYFYTNQDTYYNNVNIDIQPARKPAQTIMSALIDEERVIQNNKKESYMLTGK